MKVFFFQQNELKTYGIPTDVAYKSGNFYGTRNTVSDAWQIYDNVTKQIHELIYSMEIRLLALNKGSIKAVYKFSEKDAETKGYNKIIQATAKRTRHGYCYMVTINPDIIASGVKFVRINARTDLLIYITHSGQFFLPGLKQRVSKIK